MKLPPMRHAIVAATLLAALGLWHQPALAQMESREAIALQNQILQLQQQVQALQDQAARGGGTPTYLGRGTASAPAPSGDLVAQLLSRVDALEDQVRRLRGRIDETENLVQQQGAELGKRIDDLAFQMQNPGGALAPPGSPEQPATSLGQPPTPLGGPPAPAAPAQPGGQPAPVHRTPELVMQEGNAALARRDYPAAERAAREVLTGYRTSPRAYDAQFLLAQALAGQRQYSQAAIAYDDSYNRSRKGAHAADSLVGLAGALAAINEKKAACDTLAKLRAEFPKPRPDQREAAVSIARRTGCR